MGEGHARVSEAEWAWGDERWQRIIKGVGGMGMWAGMGYNGRGVGMGTVVGQTLAQLAMGQSPEQSQFPVTKPKQFALHKFHKVGVLMNIKWFELSDYLRRVQGS